MKSGVQARTLHWRINCYCNRRCPFCYGPDKQHEVRLETALPVIERLLANGIETLVLTGGEPLLSTKVSQVIRFAHGKGARIVLYTNCDFFDYHEDTIVECVETICVPLEGASEYTHDRIRGKNSMRAVLSVLDRHAHPGGPFKVNVGTVLGRHNLYELEGILYLLNRYAVEVWKLYEYVRYTDRSMQKAWESEQLGITDTEFRATTNSIAALPTRKTPIALSSDFSRDNSYFMLNPNMQVVIPMRNDEGDFVDQVLCDAAVTPVEEIQRIWRDSIDWDRYVSNLNASLF